MLAVGEQIVKNEKLVPKLSFNLPLSSEAVEVYEIVRVNDGKVLFLDNHIQRFRKSLEAISLNDESLIKKITKGINDLIKALKLENNNIRISVFKYTDGHADFVINAVPTVYPNEQMYKFGVQTGLLAAERTVPGIKKGHTKVRKLANDFIKENHVYEAILVNHHDLITEGSKSNIFFIKDDELYTAPDNMVLEGVMRSKVLAIANELDIDVHFEAVHIDDIEDFEGAFITGTSPRVLPIKSIDDVSYNAKHPIAIKLRQAVAELISEQA